MKNKKSLTHIEVKDNGVRLSNKVGDLLSEAMNILRLEIMDRLIKSKDNENLKFWQIEQNLKLRDFKAKSKDLIKASEKELKKSLNKDKTVNLTPAQVKYMSNELNKGLEFLRTDAIKTYESLVNKTLVELRSNKSLELSDALSKHLESGIQLGTVYQDGKVFKFDTYFEMKARTEIQTEIKDNMIQTGHDAGVIFYITSYYGDCAKDHADYQGKIYFDRDWRANAPKDRIEEIENYISSNKLMSVQEVTGAPVYLTSRPNCRHYFQAVDIDSVLGVKNEKDLNTLRSERDLNFNGKYKPEKYKALQQQRANERKIRAEKQEIEKNEKLLALHPGDKNIQAQILKGEARVRNIQKDQRDLIKNNPNLDRNYDREQIGNRVDFGVKK